MAKKKEAFLLVSLEEDKAKKLAQVVSNDTCRKILDYLSEKEATESEMAEDLEIPISTVHYNLQHLIKSGLVTAEEFHYSEKGKEVNHYKLANKYIIIAPKSTWGLKEKLKKVLPLGIFTIVAAAAIEITSRLIGGLGAGANFAADMTVESSQPMIQATPTAARTLADATPKAMTTAASAAPALWQHAAFWFFIGGFASILVYLIVDWVREKKE